MKTYTTKEVFLNATVAFLALISSMTIATTTLYAEDERGEHEERGFWHGYQKQSTGIQPADPLYKKECGSCHFAYQPGLLPKRSWDKMMTGLAEHFGTDASLDAADAEKIKTYLAENAADSANADYKYYQKLNRSIAPNETPLRISKVPYFVKEHREIPARLITQKEVKSLANCQKCHITADKGIYGERGIKIPNYGRWDD